MKEHPEALLATQHPLDFVQAKAKLSQLVRTYKLDTLLRHGFTLKHLDAMCDGPACTLRELYTAYGMAATNEAFSLNTDEIQSRCGTLASLMDLGLSAEEIRSVGLGLDTFMKRGAVLADLVRVPLYKELDSSDSSFAEFSTSWDPSYEQLETLGCTDAAVVDELTDWEFSSIPQARAAPRPAPVQLKDTLHAFKLNLNY